MKRIIGFPENILWGAATSSYQIEGAYDADGKGRSIWDEFTEREGVIKDGSTGKTACNHYSRYKEDVGLMKKLNLGSYRFSVSWPRIIPDASGQINPKGIDFYMRLVDELLSKNIRQFVTLFHWDLPQWMEKKGGWLNRDSAGYFADYAFAVSRRLGDRVKLWTTLNEPLSVVSAGYISGDHAPGHKSLFKGFTAAHNLLRAHGKGMTVLRQTVPDAEAGIALNLFPIVPERPRDQSFANGIDTFVNSFFLDPILKGRYPKPFWPVLHLFMKRAKSADIMEISQPVDFIGVNHYTRILVRKKLIPEFKLTFEEFPEVSPRHTELGFEIVPDSFYDMLLWLKKNYDNPPVYITENGAAFNDTVKNGKVDDIRRLRYLEEYLVRLRNAIDAGCDIKGYFVWSLLDNFEWSYGYDMRFGLIYVDYTTQKRIIKRSGRWYADLCRKSQFLMEYDRK
ncbi:MAG: GH1 family beta-glucosidase [Spirochaetota bacterium]